MRFYGSARHIQLAGDFGVVAALQEQFHNLLLARAEPNGLFPHHSPCFLASSPSPEMGSANGSRIP
jgi:hypothetical protein